MSTARYEDDVIEHVAKRTDRCLVVDEDALVEARWARTGFRAAAPCFS
jgi:hypothetical protein